jgi:hypothetical protein
VWDGSFSALHHRYGQKSNLIWRAICHWLRPSGQRAT